MIYYKGYKIKKSNVYGYITILKNEKLSGYNLIYHSSSFNEIKGAIRLDIERGKR